MTENLVLMQALTRKMEWTEKRHATIAQNISHADTPGYLAHDIAPVKFNDLLKNSTSKISMRSAGMATTNPGHITSSGTSGSSAKAKEVVNKTPYEMSPTGNTVILEEQMMLLGKNMSEHDLATNLYEKQVQFLKESTK